MKNILFVVFLFLPFLSYSQVVSHSFEDSVLTVLVSLDTTNKSSNFQSETAQRDTIIIKYPPKSLNFLFTDIDSTTNKSRVEITLARGRRVIGTVTTRKNKLYLTSIVAKIIWDTDNLYIFKEDKLISSLFIFNEVDIENAKQLQEKIIQDSLNRIAAIEYHKNHFEKLKEPQENLTEKDKKKIAKIYSKVISPNGVKIDSLIFLDETEINNIHWMEYMHYLYEDSLKQKYSNSLPNTTVWEKEFYKKNQEKYLYDYHYLRHPGFRYYPIVGISYQQAQEYCIWRANMVNNGWKKQNKNKDYEVIVHYRLPTKEEWEYAAIKDDLNKQFGGYSTKRRYTEKEKRKIYRSAKDFSDSTYSLEKVKLDMKNYFESDTSYKRMFNYKPNYEIPYFLSQSSIWTWGEERITSWIYLYKPTRQFKLYNMFGNVAEMTSEKGIAKGGSFVHTLEESAADKVQKYDSPQAWLGFRCVAEVVVRKKDGK